MDIRNEDNAKPHALRKRMDPGIGIALTALVTFVQGLLIWHQSNRLDDINNRLEEIEPATGFEQMGGEEGEAFPAASALSTP